MSPLKLKMLKNNFNPSVFGRGRRDLGDYVEPRLAHGLSQVDLDS